MRNIDSPLSSKLAIDVARMKYEMQLLEETLAKPFAESFPELAKSNDAVQLERIFRSARIAIKSNRQIADSMYEMNQEIVSARIRSVRDIIYKYSIFNNLAADDHGLFRLGQMDMREAAAQMLMDLADGTQGLVCATLIDAAERVRNLQLCEKAEETA